MGRLSCMFMMISYFGLFLLRECSPESEMFALESRFVLWFEKKVPRDCC
jgi:hypothetical protein